MVNAFHGKQTKQQGIHGAISFEYADAAARTSAGPFQSYDKDKLATQLDTGEVYILTDPSGPTWELFTTLGGVGGAVDSVFGRTGDVVAVSGDYDSDQIDNISTVSGISVSDALETLQGQIIGGGGGTVTGPISTTDNAITRWNGTDGYTIQNSGIIIDDSDNITGVNDLVVGGNITVTGTVDGRDVSVDGSTLDSHIADASIHFTLQDIGLDGYALDSDLQNHISDTANPHATSIANLGSGTLAQLNAIVTDATLDDASDSRNPTLHASTHEVGGSDELDGYDLVLFYSPNNYLAPINDLVGEHIAAIDDALSNSGVVTSVFGRIGDVVAVSGDYDSDQIDNVSAISGATVSDALETLNGLIVGGGSGTVSGPVSTTDNAIVRWSGTDGYIIQDSNIIIDDLDNITGVDNLSVGGNITVIGTVDGRDVSDDGSTLDSHIADVNIHFTVESLGLDGYALDLDLQNHISDVANPHATDIGNLGSGTLAELNAIITDATLDDSGDPRTPTAHGLTHENGGSDEIEISNLGTLETDTTLVLKPDGIGGVSWVADDINNLDGYVFETRQVIAGAGLIGGGDLSIDRTFNVAANVDGSIIVNANDIQVGILATDAQHGIRGGGTQHAEATISVAGFMSATDKIKLDGISTGAEVNTVDSVFGRVGAVVAEASDYDASQIFNDSSVPGTFVSDALDNLDEQISLIHLDGYALDSDLQAHILDSNNPHSTDIGNLGSGTLTELNAIITDATLDDSGDPRTPTSHASTHQIGGSDELDGYDLSFVYAPSNYVAPTGNVLGEHIAAIDDALANAGGVTSVFGRTGIIVAEPGDYDSDQINNASAISGVTVSDALETLNGLIVGGGAGTVSGPNTTTDNAIVRWSGTDGYTIQNSGIIIDDSDNITGVNNLSVIGTVDGRDVSADGSTLDSHITNTSIHFTLQDIGLDGYALDLDLQNHISDTVNPHATDIGNLGSGTLAELNLIITDATLDDSGDPRTPLDHNSTHVLGGSDEIDGDELDIDFIPSNYTPTIGTPGSNVNHLAAHLRGIDNIVDTIPSPAPVDSVFGRTGVVVAESSDYDASQINNDSTLVTGAFVSDALDNLAETLDGYALDINLQNHISDGTIHFSAESLGLDGYVLDSDLQSHITDATIHFTAESLGLDGYVLDVDFQSHVSNTSIHFTAESLGLDGYSLNSITMTAGAGLTGGGDLSANRTFDIGANADGSIIVNTNDIQVGTLANDSQHGNLGGGSLHNLVTTTTAGFISSDGYNKLESIETGAQVNTVDSVFGRTGSVVALISDYDASQIDNDSVVPGAFVDDALNYLDGYIGSVFTDFESHADRHEFGGADQIDGYELELTYSPMYYATPVNNKLGEHIAAIDDALAGAGFGDVVGPASSTDEALVRFDGITGKLIQNSNATLTDGGALTLTLGLTTGGDIDVGGNSITNINLVDGVDVSSHASRHEFGGADTIEISNLSTSETDTTLVLKPDGAGSVAWVVDQVRDLDGYVFEDRQVIAGAGLVGGGDLSADRTFDVVANADGSIVVNANDIQVGVLASDIQHGNLGGGSLHNLATAFVAGFFSTDGYIKLDGIENGAQVNTVDSVFGRTGAVIALPSDYDASQIDNDSIIPGSFVDDALNNIASIIDGYALEVDLQNHISDVTIHFTADSLGLDGYVLDIDFQSHVSDNTIHFTADSLGLDGYALVNHATNHEAGGTDEIDGDQLDIDWNPTNYIPTTSPTEVTSIDHLTAHLAGIDAILGTIGGGGLTAPIDPDEDGYVAIANSGDLIYISGQTDGYILTWENSEWISAAPKKITTVEFALTEDVNNTTQTFYTWSADTSGGLRSSSGSGMQNPNSCNPYQVPFNSTITKAVLTVKGAGVQNGSVSYPVLYQTDLLEVGFSSEGKLADIDFSISSAFTVGTFSPGDTNFKGSTSLSIDVDEGDMLGMRFVNGNANNLVGQTRMAFITLILEER